MTAPRRRRRYEPDWPANLTGRRRRLGRFLLLAAVGLAVSVFATLGGGEDPPAPAAAPAAASASARTAIATATTSRGTGTPAPAPGPVALEHRADGWYLRDAEAWPLVTVERIVDGDTLDIRVSGVTLRIRVYGVNTPERGEACYAEATQGLAALAGREVRLVPDRRQQDGFRRELRYLLTPAGRSIDAALLDQGLARAWREDGSLRETLVPIEEAARAAKRGCLWAG